MSFKRPRAAFPLERFLTVIGTNYRTFGVGPATFLNRLFTSRASSASITTGVTVS